MERTGLWDIKGHICAVFKNRLDESISIDRMWYNHWIRMCLELSDTALVLHELIFSLTLRIQKAIFVLSHLRLLNINEKSSKKFEGHLWKCDRKPITTITNRVVSSNEWATAWFQVPVLKWHFSLVSWLMPAALIQELIIYLTHCCLKK